MSDRIVTIAYVNARGMVEVLDVEPVELRWGPEAPGRPECWLVEAIPTPADECEDPEVRVFVVERIFRWLPSAEVAIGGPR